MITDETKTLLLQAGNARFDGSDLTKYIEAIEEALAIDLARHDAEVRASLSLDASAVIA